MGYPSFHWSKLARKKILRKNLVFTTFLVFWSISPDTLVPWSPWVTRYTGGLSQLPLVEISLEKILRKKPVFRTFYLFWSILSDTLVPWSP